MLRLRMFVIIGLLSVVAACSFKILRPVDDTESSWRPVEPAPAAASSAPPPPMEHGY
jgi:hypothetical protein